MLWSTQEDKVSANNPYGFLVSLCNTLVIVLIIITLNILS